MLQLIYHRVSPNTIRAERSEQETASKIDQLFQATHSFMSGMALATVIETQTNTPTGG